MKNAALTALSILRILHTAGAHFAKIDAKKRGLNIEQMVEHSTILPILARYGIGCEWEFAEYSILRVLKLINTSHARY
jgi:hypothetical protein